MAPRDYYEVLGVERGASEDDVRKAYRKIAFQHHPDRNPGDKAAEQKFKEATEAYEVLRDAEKRARYDQLGHAGVSGGAGGPAGFDASGFDLADALRAFMRDFGGFEDLFGAAGGGGGGRAGRGDDLQLRLKLTLEEVATGVEKKIKVKHLKTCATCNGRGGQGATSRPARSAAATAARCASAARPAAAMGACPTPRPSRCGCRPGSRAATSSRCAAWATPAFAAGRPAT